MALAGCGDHRTPVQPDANCPQVCDLGAQRCNGNNVETCGPGADQCPAWGAPTACPADKPICGGGACGRGCQDDCVMGARMCDGTSAMKICGVTGGDVCLHWGPSMACAGIDLCAQGSCMAPVALNVAIDGAGTGTVTSNPAGIDCGLYLSCGNYFPLGLPVTLTATPSGDSTFLGWSGGGCSTGSSCTTTSPYQIVGTTSPPPPVRAIFGAPWQWRGFAGQARAPRDDETATWIGDQLVVWGGNTTHAVFNNDGERYAPATGTWSDINAVGAPQERYSHSAVWTGTELIIWGGSTDDFVPGGLSNGGARWNPVTGVWTPLPTAGAPERRRDHVAFWTGTEMIIWGGYDLTGYPISTGARFDPAAGTWTALPTAGAPSPREHASVTWTGTNLVVWGGTSGIGITALDSGDRWNAASNTWSPIPTAGAPAPRSKHSATWTGSELIVWGGTANNSDFANGARWSQASDTWTALATTNAPSARHAHSATWTGSQLVIWGGTNATGALRDGARVTPSGGSWTAITTTGAPTARSGHAAVWTGDEILIWGGADANDATATSVARLSPTTWTWQGTAPPPSARWAHAGVWTGTELLVWGGFAGGAAVGDGGRFHKATSTWTPVAATGAPAPRGLHSAVWTGTEMVVWGGFDRFDLDMTALASGARYNPTTGTWTALPTANAPVARGGHSAVWTGTDMVIWGGFGNDFTNLGDGARWNPATNTWSPLVVDGAPSPRGAHTAVWTGTEMIIWGGMDSILTSGFHDDGGRFDPATNTWTTLPATGAPSARSAHSAIWTGAEMIIWGGASGGDLSSGSRWSPTTGTWHTVSNFNAPDSRRFQVAAWTGAEMIVWGGIHGGNSLATGGVLIRSP